VVKRVFVSVENEKNDLVDVAKAQDSLIEPVQTVISEKQNAETVSEPSAKEKKATTDSPAVTPTKPAATKLIVNNRYEILLNRPVSDYEHAFADVYDAVAKDRGHSYMAYVLNERYPVRLDVADMLIKTDTPNLLTVRDYGVGIASDGAQRFVVLTEKPSSPPIMNKLQIKRAPISEDILRRNILKPLVQVLRSLHAMDIIHHNMRPDNIFWNNLDSNEAVLGDCVTSLPGANQPALYETIERGMADPCGRGVGSEADDIYAFGATMAVLLRGSDPMAGKSDRAIVEEKVIRGSVQIFTENMQISSTMMEFFKGTLHDEPKARWTAEQIWTWAIGNHVTSKQVVSHRKSSKILEFNGGKYTHLRLLARDLRDNTTEAMGLIESGALLKWLERSLMDKNFIEAVQETIARANYNSKASGYEDRMVCMVAMALDPRAPIRYRDMTALPEGMGGALVHAIIQDQSVQSYAECIREKIGWIWYGFKENETQISVDLAKRFDNMSKIIMRRGIDSGLERCVYEMLPDTPCLSPSLSSFYVMNCVHLLQALDKIGQDKMRPQTIIDRHIASFISTHDTKDNSIFFILMEGSDALKKPLSLITLFQSMQKRYQVPQLSGLCDWLLPEIEIVAQRFHNRKHRRTILKNVQMEVKNGNLVRVLALIDNPNDMNRDRMEFQNARGLYEKLEKEHDYLENNLKRHDVFGRATGRQIAAAISAIMGGLLIAIIILAKISNISSGF
jgi:serine/threonine protein kinase